MICCLNEDYRLLTIGQITGPVGWLAAVPVVSGETASTGGKSIIPLPPPRVLPIYVTPTNPLNPYINVSCKCDLNQTPPSIQNCFFHQLGPTGPSWS